MAGNSGFTQIANELLEALIGAKVPREARQVLDVIIRKTYGFNKRSDWVSLSQFSKMTGLAKPNVQRALKRLIAMKIVLKGESFYRPSYSINETYKQWQKDSRLSTCIQGRVCNVLKAEYAKDSRLRHTKDTLTKDTLTKDKKRQLKKREHEDREFRVWFESKEGQVYVKKIGEVLGWTMDGMLAASHHAELWLADPDNPSRSKWGAFFRNWLENNKRFERERQEKKQRLTTEEEQDHYASKGGGQRSGDPEKVGDILNRVVK